jgi:hypothetical protein
VVYIFENASTEFVVPQICRHNSLSNPLLVPGKRNVQDQNHGQKK